MEDKNSNSNNSPLDDITTEEESSMVLAAAEAFASAEDQEQILALQQRHHPHLHHQQQHHHEQLQQQHEQNDQEQPRQLHQQQNHDITNGDHLLLHHDDFISHDDPKLKCQICGKGLEDDGRALCHFLPTEVDENTMDVAPGVHTFGQEIVLHVFCGKTASILPNVNQPDLEILSKAGLKNKHGIGPEVNGALARTRSSTIAAEGTKEKTFFLVKEFEAHLAAIRNASLNVASMNFTPYDHLGLPLSPYQQQHQKTNHHHHHHLSSSLVDVMTGSPGETSFEPLFQHIPSTTTTSTLHHSGSASKTIPIKASHSYQKRDPWARPLADSMVTTDGKVRCGCGGTHLPSGTARGDASWRSHVMTKRHQKWMEENGLLGAV